MWMLESRAFNGLVNIPSTKHWFFLYQYKYDVLYSVGTEQTLSLNVLLFGLVDFERGKCE